jgi:hypothetical protein
MVNENGASSSEAPNESQMIQTNGQPTTQDVSVSIHRVQHPTNFACVTILQLREIHFETGLHVKQDELFSPFGKRLHAVSLRNSLIGFNLRIQTFLYYM